MNVGRTPARIGVAKEAAAPVRLTIVRTPAVQGVWAHRHWPLEENGRFVDHAHAIGKRAHEHLAQRLGRVVLSFADKGAALFPTYVEDDEPLPFRVAAAWIAVPVIALFLGVLFAVGLR